MIADSERDVLALIDELQSLRDGDTTVAKLAACGAKAIEPLRSFLFFGKPAAVYQPRQLAVEALAALGARDILMEYLRRTKDIADPAARFGEEAVESTAARLLGRWQTEETFAFLMALARERRLLGLIETLGEFRQPEALPYLEQALEDDYYRPVAEDALRKFGAAARPLLLHSAATSTNLRRRRSAARLLAEIGPGHEPATVFLPLMDDDDPDVVVSAAKLLSASTDPAVRSALVRRLIEVLPRAGWHLRDDIEAFGVRCLGTTLGGRKAAASRETPKARKR